MEITEIDSLIRFHQAGLAQHRQHMDPSAIYLEERTIKALGELKNLAEKKTREREGDA